MRNKVFALTIFIVTLLMYSPFASAEITSITAIVDGYSYACGLPPPPLPEYKVYCSCSELFGRTKLNLMAFNPQTGEEKKVRELAEFSGSAVYPAMPKCRQAIQKHEFSECSQ